jgi:deoxyinosine 3'endonuclease (endonuclease V)
VDGLDKRQVRASISEPQHDKILSESGFVSVPVIGQSGRVWGAAVRATKTTGNPVYVSVGHRVSLSTALELVKATSLYRVPEPVRQADLLSRDMLRDLAAKLVAT